MIPDGIILLDKKKGITSMASDNFIKKVGQTRKAGHSGTLDPFATGLLPVFTGRALKVMRYTDDYDKAYDCTVVFGKSTTTMDPEGEVVRQTRLNGTPDEFEAVKETFLKLKDITSQTPPSFSAKKVGGKKAYDLARKGEEVILPPHPVKIYALDINNMKYEDGLIYADISVECSKGTYIRSLCDDAGRITGFNAYALTLRRTKAGPFSVNDAYTEEQISDMVKENDYSFVIPAHKALCQMPRIELNRMQFDEVRLGKKISSEPFTDAEEGVKVAAFHEERLTAVLYKEGDIMRIERMLAVD